MNLERHESAPALLILPSIARPETTRAEARPSRAGFSVLTGKPIARPASTARSRLAQRRSPRPALRAALRPVPRPAPEPGPVAEPAARAGERLRARRGWLALPLVAASLLAPAHAAPWRALLAFALVGAGLLLRTAASASLGDAAQRTPRRLVTWGAHAWVRHPAYVGELVAWAGLALLAGGGWLAPLLLLAIGGAYAVIVREEEAALETRLGDEWLRYARRTPRWVPRKPIAALAGHSDWAFAWRAERIAILTGAALALALAGQAMMS